MTPLRGMTNRMGGTYIVLGSRFPVERFSTGPGSRYGAAGCSAGPGATSDLATRRAMIP